MPVDATDQQTLDHIAEHGWAGIHVLEDDEGPGFSYSIGFWETLRVPEAIIFGLDNKLMHSMLWSVFEQAQAGKTFEDGGRWSDLIVGCDCVARPVHASHFRKYFGGALWYRRHRGQTDRMAAYQLFWPGKLQGLYPWETNCDATVRWRQPALYLPDTVGLA